jgi:hypothetical protein
MNFDWLPFTPPSGQLRRYHFLRDHVEKREIEMKFIDTERQLADIFIKHLDSSRFGSLRWELGVCHLYCLV